MEPYFLLAAWGFDFASEFFTKIPISEKFLSYFSNLFKSSKADHTAKMNLLKDLGMIRNDVKKEYKWFQEGSLLKYVNEDDRTEAKRKRLLYLFVRDLMSGVGGTVLDNKDSRDNVKVKKVYFSTKFIGWTFVIVLNAGLLFYIYLFARTQTQSRQSAWFISFVMWLVFEVLVSSTAVVFLTHLLIPLYVLSDIRNIKKKVLSDILEFRKTALQRRGLLKSNSENESTAFNAAKYLYRSWRVAHLFPDLKESEIILCFNTPWPQHSFKQVTATVTSAYERRYSFIYQAVSRVAIFFLASLLNLPQLVQDAVVQITSSSGLGYMGLMFIRLYSINPFLIGVPVLCFCLLVHFGLNSSIRNEQLKKARDLLPLEEEAMMNEKVDHPKEAMIVPEQVEWEEHDDFDEFHPSVMPSSAANQKIAEGRRMSQFMLHNLHNDIAKRQGINTPVNAPNLAEFQESYWSDSDEDMKEMEYLTLDRPELPQQQGGESLQSQSLYSSEDGTEHQHIFWDDEDNPSEYNSVDIDSHIPVQIWDNDNEGSFSESKDSSSGSISRGQGSFASADEEDSLASHLSAMLPDSSVDQIWLED